MSKKEAETGPAREEARFVEQMKALREARGWSQADLAAKLNELGWDYVNQMTISRTEKNDRPLRLGEARAIASVLGKTVEQMLAPDADAKAIDSLFNDVEHMRVAVRQIEDGIDDFLSYRPILQYSLDQVRELDLARWASLDLAGRVSAQVARAEEVLRLTPSDLLASALSSYEENHQLEWANGMRMSEALEKLDGEHSEEG